MRGSLGFQLGTESGGGIIPAHAGLTQLVGLRGIVIGDHPRACGAHSGGVLSLALDTGSSPRMRGSRSKGLACHLAGGIIPAHAGLTKRNV